MTLRLIENPPTWPNGARCAVCFSFDLDAESLMHLYHPKSARSRVSASSTLRYGPNVSVPRLIRVFEHFGIHQTFFTPGWCIEEYPDAIKALDGAGHEVAHHSWLHEHPNRLTLEDERRTMERALEAFHKVIGKGTVGYRAPSGAIHANTFRLLTELGFLYSSSLHDDDIPYIIETEAGTLIELPTDPALDDWPQYVNMKEFGFAMTTKSPAQAYDLFRAEFDAAWEARGMWITIWHPFVAGRLGRTAELVRLIEHMKQKGGVWFATTEEIARHVEGEIAAGRYTPRRQPLPYRDKVVEHLVQMHDLED